MGQNRKNMTTVNIQTTGVNYNDSSPSLFTQFINWTKGQEQNRLLWVGLIIAAHGCILTPITVMAVLVGGAPSLSLVVLAIIAMGMALVTNLAAQPTKVTIPVFLLSVVLDVAILVTSIIQQTL